MTSGALSIFTPRAATLVLRSVSDPSRETTARRGDRLEIISQLGRGFAEVEYLGQRWFAAESGLEPWGSFREAAPLPAAVPPVAPQRVAGQVQGYGDAGPAVVAIPWGGPGYDRPCPSCGRGWGNGRSCQFCRQLEGLPSGIHISSPGKRLGAFLIEWFAVIVIEAVSLIVTFSSLGLALSDNGGVQSLSIPLLLVPLALSLGWLVWSFMLYARGQTPAKMLLGMRVVDVRNGRRAGWGTMFLREIVFKWLLATVLGVFTAGIGYVIYYLWLLWDKDNQQLWDKMLHTIVVDDPYGRV